MLFRNFIAFTFLLFLVAVFGLETRAQQYDLITLSSKSGLRGLQINNIAQDSLGYLWVATDDGASRFDGKQFVNYHHRQGLSENYCTTIFCDKEQRIWVGHQTGGISVINGDSVQIYTESNGLVNNEVHDIFQASDGNIWVATFGGVSIFDGENWTTKTVSDGLISNNIKAISEDENGAIWLGTFGSGINIINGGVIELAHRGNGLINNHITDLTFVNGQMLIGTLGGIGSWKNNQFNNHFATDKRINSQINGVSLGINQDLWLATYTGVKRVRNGQQFNIREENGLPNNEVLCVFIDAENNTWLGTRKGLVRVQNLAFSHYFSSPELDIEPSFLFKDSKKTIWVANETGGVLRYDGVSFRTAFEDPDINNHQIGSIAEDGDGNLWFGSMDFGGLFQWDGKNIYIYSDELGLADNNINCLLEDADGNLLIGTPSGLSRFDGVDFSSVFLSDEFSSNHITTLELATDKIVWIGTADGSVFSLRDGKVEDINIETTSAITDICQSKFGVVFTAGLDGIFLLKNEKIRHLRTESGTKNFIAQSVVQLEERLYIGTSRGLQQLQFSGNSVIIQHSLIADNHAVANCKMGAILADENGLWIGTELGVSHFAPAEQKQNKRPPSAFLTAVQLNYQEVDWPQKGFDVFNNGLPQNLELDYTENVVRFFFKGIDHAHPEMVNYKWMLEGLETDWSPVSHQEMANYPSLTPNHYTFKVIACNNNEVCSDPVTFSFTIRPPFWQTWGFYVFMGVAGLLLTYVYIKRRERVLRKEKQMLETTVEQRTKQLREQKEIVEAQNHHITEGIEYAKNIQMAILPSKEELARAFRGNFIFYRPKEAVGGDFYWEHSKDDISWAAAVDCTGHGVSGAFMSMIGSDLLNQIIIEQQVDDPATVLDEMDKGIKLAFAQSAKEFESDQGMDVSLIRLNRKNNTIRFAGAQRPLFACFNGELTETEGDRFSISSADGLDKKFTTHELKAEHGMILYLFSDGIADQFGGPKGKKFMVRRLRELLRECAGKSMKEQHALLVKTFEIWKGDENQIDDILLMGIQL